MSFIIPELVVESVIRDGILNIQNTPTILDDVFAQLNANYATRKYGTAEITKIKTLLTGGNKTNLAIVHGQHITEANIPCISIALGSDNEARETYLGDFDEDLEEDITDEDELEDLIRVASFTPTSYDSVTGMIRVANGVSLADVYTNFIFVDADEEEFVILRGISNTTGDKYFFIAAGESPNIAAGCVIKTFLDVTQLEIKSTHDDIQLILGVHTKDALLTKYVYILVKYWLRSRRASLIKRGILNTKLSGTDFGKLDPMQGDSVFVRSVTLTGLVENSWRSDDVETFDRVVLDAEAVGD